MSSNVQIVPFSPAYRHTFAELWVRWLKQLTGNDPEPEDQRVMDDPQAFYIASGGSIFFALIDSQPLGVVAVRKLSPQVFKFCKLVVLERGAGAWPRPWPWPPACRSMCAIFARKRRDRFDAAKLKENRRCAVHVQTHGV